MGGRGQSVQAAASPYVMRRVPGSNSVGNWNTGAEPATMQRQAIPRPAAIAMPGYEPDIEPVEVVNQMPRQGSQEAPQAAPAVPGPFAAQGQQNLLTDKEWAGLDDIGALLALIKGGGQPKNTTTIPWNPNGAMPWLTGGR